MSDHSSFMIHESYQIPQSLPGVYDITHCLEQSKTMLTTSSMIENDRKCHRTVVNN